MVLELAWLVRMVRFGVVGVVNEDDVDADGVIWWLGLRFFCFSCRQDRGRG